MAVSFKQLPRILNLNRTPSRPKNRKKICLTFDEDKRKEFITGFRKRKLQRRQKAAEELQEKWKEEKKRIKEEIKKKYKTLLSQRDVPELEELLSKQEYETDGKTVSILELNINDLSQGSNWIGENRPSYEEPASETLKSSEENDESDEEILGMDLNSEKKNKNETEGDNKDDECEIPEIPSSKTVQKETLRQTLKSQVFKKKQKWESMKNRKKAHKKKVMKEKLIKKAQKKNKKTRIVKNC